MSAPSIKMTSLYHYNDPLVNIANSINAFELSAVIVKGVSDKIKRKLYTSEKTAQMCQQLGIDCAIVAMDSWGNHHIDFTTVMHELENRNIPCSGITFMGNMAPLVIKYDNVDSIVDFVKNKSGLESTIVGENDLSTADVKKAFALLSKKLKSRNYKLNNNLTKIKSLEKLIRYSKDISEIKLGNKNQIIADSLILNIEELLDISYNEDIVSKVNIKIISPDQKDIFTHTKLDFFPIATKKSGILGTGETIELNGICTMLTAFEENTGYEPCNMGSSEGILKQKVVFDKIGTPKNTNYIINIEVIIKEGRAMKADGIIEAYKISDKISQKIRNLLKNIDTSRLNAKTFYNLKKDSALKLAIIKVVSGYGCMYDTFLKATEPCGIIGATNIRQMDNMPFLLTANEVMDGAIKPLQ